MELSGAPMLPEGGRGRKLRGQSAPYLAGIVPCDPTTGGGSQSLEWGARTSATVSKRTTYLHTTRCAGGTHGQQVKTSSSIYKKCPGARRATVQVWL
jgi:hypothetical protein